MLRLALALAAVFSAQLLSAAKQEGTVVWYTSMDVKALNAIVARFQETHPGITLQVLRAGANQIPPRVMTEQTAGAYNADLISGDLLAMSQLVAAGAIQPYRPTEVARFVKGSYDPNGYWISIYNATTVIAWNPRKLKAEDSRRPRRSPIWRSRNGAGRS